MRPDGLHADDPPKREVPAAEAGLDQLDPRQWRRTISDTMAACWRGTSPIALAPSGVSWLAFCSMLGIVGYPTWRAIALAGVGLVGIAPYVLARVHGRFLPGWATSEQFPLTVFLFGSLFTGGIYSPMIVSALGPISQAVRLRGIARPTVRRVGLFSLGLVVLAVLPQAWVGPRLPAPVMAPGVLLFLLPSILLQLQHASLAERTLASMIEQLVQAREEVASQAQARARELELLSSRLSHELKNPLGAAKALVQLTMRTAPECEARELLAEVASETTHLQTILQEYLSFSRPLISLQRRSVQVGAVVDDVLAAAERRAQAGSVTLERRGDARIRADPARLAEALVHLVANAIEATPPRGRVRVEVEDRRGAIEIAVRDTGSGMTPEVLARVGAPFYTTRARGTGLGVLLARSVITQHGGSLRFVSTPGDGTVAIVSLPAGTGEEAPWPPAAARRRAPVRMGVHPRFNRARTS